jgi:hypothetical protein
MAFWHCLARGGSGCETGEFGVAHFMEAMTKIEDRGDECD